MMKETATRAPRRRTPYAAKKPMSSASAAQLSSQPVAPARPLATPPPQVAQDGTRFSDLAKDNLLSPILLKTITEDLKFDYMMPVQSATLHDLLEKRIDCLAQAKTGTGKTIAFLLPAIQTLLNQNRKPGSGVSLLVISPTRELALQIAKEAQQLLGRLPQYKVYTAIGGTNKNEEERRILAGCDILVATPGRLNDHLSDQRVQDQFRNLNTLVLDEADRLLDMGFMTALEDIIKCLPDKRQSRRQGMLFSATIAPHVQKFAHLVLSDGYKFISTIPEGEASTHEHVPQFLDTVTSFADVAPALVSALQAECATTGPAKFKAIVFAQTAALADWYGALLSALPTSSANPLPPVSVLHSRLSQTARTRITEQFKKSEAAILVATDVVARGMDFPNVSTVVQAGVPSDKESYIHRLGRTARAGRDGRSVLIVTKHESFFPNKTLKDITFQPYTSSTPSTAAVVHSISAAMTDDRKGKTYQAWLGYYKSLLRPLGWTAERLVAEANEFAKDSLKYDGVPPLQKSTVGKMGLKKVRGLNVVPDVIKPRRSDAPPGGKKRGGGNAPAGPGTGRAVA